MKRNTPLRRSRFKKKPARRIAARKADQPFRDWLHEHGECVCIAAFDHGIGMMPSKCWGRIEQSHGPHMSTGSKAPETESWPACHGHHQEWEEHAGTFRGWSKEARREFSRAMSEATQARWRFYQSRQPGVMVDGENPSRPEVVEPLKQPPGGEVIHCSVCGLPEGRFLCRHCIDVPF